MSKPVCFITGIVDGTGAALARRFAKAGYRVVMLALFRFDHLLQANSSPDLTPNILEFEFI